MKHFKLISLDTTCGAKHYKTETSNYRILDQTVGGMRLLYL
jgi:hypothetical protein